MGFKIKVQRLKFLSQLWSSLNHNRKQKQQQIASQALRQQDPQNQGVISLILTKFRLSQKIQQMWQQQRLQLKIKPRFQNRFQNRFYKALKDALKIRINVSLGPIRRFRAKVQAQTALTMTSQTCLYALVLNASNREPYCNIKK